MRRDLPRTPELMEKYRASKDAEYPQLHVLAVYDALNCRYTDAAFGAAPADERKIASELI